MRAPLITLPLTDAQDGRELESERGRHLLSGVFVGLTARATFGMPHDDVRGARILRLRHRDLTRLRARFFPVSALQGKSDALTLVESRKWSQKDHGGRYYERDAARELCRFPRRFKQAPGLAKGRWVHFPIGYYKCTHCRDSIMAEDIRQNYMIKSLLHEALRQPRGEFG